jgi:hypothetical protein
VVSNYADGTTSAPTTTSTTYATIPEMTASFTPTTTVTVTAYMSIAFSISSQAAIASFGLALDGAAEQGVISAQVASNGARGWLTIFARWANVSAAAHTVTGRWNTSAGTLSGITTQRHLLVEQAG